MELNDPDFGCLKCGRYFRTLFDAQQHMRNKHSQDSKGQPSQKAQCAPKAQSAPKPQPTKKDQDTKKPQDTKQQAQKKQLQWCIRCDKSFTSQRNLDQHILTSNMHHICDLCPDPSASDFISPSILQNHLHATHRSCEICLEACRSSSQLLEHRIKKHNLCLECNKCHLTPQQLKSHLITHDIKDIDCPGCDAMFHNDAEMILHLETQCKSGADREWVLKTALQSPQAARFTNQGFGQHFKCPTCQKKFREISGVLQHTIAMPNCDEELGEGPLTDFVDYIRELMDRIRQGTQTKA